MTIYKTAYDTTACSGFRTKDTQDKLRQGALSGAYRTVRVRTNHNEEGLDLLLLEGGNSSADVIPYFYHPMVVPAPALKEPRLEFAIDVRSFGKWYAPNQVFVVRNHPEYDWHIKRAILNYVWMTERPEILRDISPIPAQVYAALMSECVARRFALDPGEKIKVAVVAAYFYYGLFSEDRLADRDEMEHNKIVGMVARATKVPADTVFTLLQDLPLINDLSFLCECIKKVTGSVALQDLNHGVLIAIMSGTWYGVNARENLAVALEHAPTWLMCVAASLQEATFKRSQLAKISMNFDRQNAASHFIKALDVLVGGPTVVADQVNTTE